MNDWLIVDASVIIKAFVEEPGSDLAGLIWQSDAILAAPAHALAEVGEALRRKRKRNEIREEQWREISLVVPGSFISIGLDDLFEPAMRITTELSQSFYDSLYLAAAERWECALVTADESLVRAAVGSVWQARILTLQDYANVRAG